MKLVYDPNKPETSENYMDRWILSFTQSLIKYVRQEMQGNLYPLLIRLSEIFGFVYLIDV